MKRIGVVLLAAVLAASAAAEEPLRSPQCAKPAAGASSATATDVAPNSAGSGKTAETGVATAPSPAPPAAYEAKPTRAVDAMFDKRTAAAPPATGGCPAHGGGTQLIKKSKSNISTN
jgi:hypothetical protein